MGKLRGTGEQGTKGEGWKKKTRLGPGPLQEGRSRTIQDYQTYRGRRGRVVGEEPRRGIR